MDIAEAGIAIQKYGAAIIPADKLSAQIYLNREIGGVHYSADTAITANNNVGDTITISKD